MFLILISDILILLLWLHLTSYNFICILSSYSSEKVNSKVKFPPFPSMAWTEGFRPQAISDSDSDNYDSDPGFDQTLIMIKLWFWFLPILNMIITVLVISDSVRILIVYCLIFLNFCTGTTSPRSGWTAGLWRPVSKLENGSQSSQRPPIWQSRATLQHHNGKLHYPSEVLLDLISLPESCQNCFFWCNFSNEEKYFIAT